MVTPAPMIPQNRTDIERGSISSSEPKNTPSNIARIRLGNMNFIALLILHQIKWQ
jgi:hypothetical protein